MGLGTHGGLGWRIEVMSFYLRKQGYGQSFIRALSLSTLLPSNLERERI
jgi:hypothetical protein